MKEEKGLGKNDIVWRKISHSSASLIQYIIEHRDLFKNNSQRDPRITTIICLVHRIMRNLRGVHVLAAESVRHNNSVFLKLPVGLVMRNCLMDSILALHIASKDAEDGAKLIALSNRNYVKALFDEFEVYRDKQTIHFDVVTAERMFTMAIEDTYLHELTFNEGVGEIEPLNERKIWRARDLKDVYEGCKRSDADIRNIKDSLSGDKGLSDCVRSLYAYYKYFSQYEHYSPLGDGDSLADFGDDNIRFEKVFLHIGKCIRYLVDAVKSDSENQI